ncbi:MAG TPA: hypothetical protein VHM01_07435 [Alphaproteobacteria bacterium]|nr:hypothetical protein [Alphaproteobacteria bacterium]
MDLADAGALQDLIDSCGSDRGASSRADPRFVIACMAMIVLASPTVLMAVDLAVLAAAHLAGADPSPPSLPGQQLLAPGSPYHGPYASAAQSCMWLLIVYLAAPRSGLLLSAIARLRALLSSIRYGVGRSGRAQR